MKHSTFVFNHKIVFVDHNDQKKSKSFSEINRKTCNDKRNYPLPNFQTREIKAWKNEDYSYLYDCFSFWVYFDANFSVFQNC